MTAERTNEGFSQAGLTQYREGWASRICEVTSKLCAALANFQLRIPTNMDEAFAQRRWPEVGCRAWRAAGLIDQLRAGHGSSGVHRA